MAITDIKLSPGFSRSLGRIFLGAPTTTSLTINAKDDAGDPAESLIILSDAVTGRRIDAIYGTTLTVSGLDDTRDYLAFALKRNDDTAQPSVFYWRP